MNRATTMKILSAGVLLALVLPMLAFPWSASVRGEMGGGCHGHHDPMPMSSHSCCYARPQAPAQSQFVLSATPLRPVDGVAALPDLEDADLAPVAPRSADLSPPAPLILRI